MLKGHIALDAQVFPQGTPGCLLDTLARQHLWEAGKNFLHGEWFVECIFKFHRAFGRVRKQQCYHNSAVISFFVCFISILVLCLL